MKKRIFPLHHTNWMQKVKLYAIALFAIMLSLQSCGEKTYLDSRVVNDLLLKEKVEVELNRLVNVKKPKIVSYESTSIQTPTDFFQAAIDSSVWEEITLYPGVTYTIQYKDGDEIKTCEAMAYASVNEKRDNTGYKLKGVGVILTKIIKTVHNSPEKHQALGYGARTTNIFSFSMILHGMLLLLAPMIFLLLYTLVIIEPIEYKTNAIVLVICLGIVLLSLFFGIYGLLRIGFAACLVVYSIFLYKYMGTAAPEYKHGYMEIKSDISLGGMIFALVFAIVLDLSAIGVFFMNDEMSFAIGYLCFISVCLLIVFYLISRLTSLAK